MKNNMQKLNEEWLLTKIFLLDSMKEKNPRIQITGAKYYSDNIEFRVDVVTDDHRYPNVFLSLRTPCLVEKFQKQPFEFEQDGFTHVATFVDGKYVFNIL